MYYIDTDTATQDHKFTDGDESQGVVATDLNANWFNMIQEELQNVVLNGGFSLNSSSNSQLWNVLSKYGIRGVLSNSAIVMVSNFPGSIAIFHDASNFVLSGALATGAVVIVVPSWVEASPSSISFGYGNGSISIPKGSFFIAMAVNQNAQSGPDMLGVCVPIVSSGKVSVGSVETGKLTAQKVIDPNIVVFNYNNENEGLQDWQTWQLMENWELNQVKKVFCNNAAQEGTGVTMYYNNNGQYRSVKFYPTSWREVMCVGQYTVTSAGGDVVFAVLLVNGKE